MPGSRFLRERYFSENFLWQSRHPFLSNFRSCAQEGPWEARKAAPAKVRIRPRNTKVRLRRMVGIRSPDSMVETLSGPGVDDPVQLLARGVDFHVRRLPQFLFPVPQRALELFGVHLLFHYPLY